MVGAVCPWQGVGRDLPSHPIPFCDSMILRADGCSPMSLFHFDSSHNSLFLWTRCYHYRPLVYRWILIHSLKRAWGDNGKRSVLCGRKVPERKGNWTSKLEKNEHGLRGKRSHEYIWESGRSSGNTKVSVLGNKTTHVLIGEDGFKSFKPAKH